MKQLAILVRAPDAAQIGVNGFKISQYLTEEIFSLAKTRGDNSNLLILPHTVIAGEYIGLIF